MSLGCLPAHLQFKSITDAIDSSAPAGRFFFHIMAALAKMERELIKERTKACLNAARARGRLSGRKSIMDASKVQTAKQLLDSGM